MTTIPLQELPIDHPFVVLRQWDESPIDETTLGVITGATTETVAQQIGFGKATHNLTLLHTLIRGYCSDRFRELNYENPTRTREEINADPNLVALNSVRSTLHQAMVRRHKQSARPRRQI